MMRGRGEQASTHSRMVRRLTHRQPLPRSAAGRALFFVRRWPRLPMALLTTVVLIAGAFAFHRYLVNSEFFSLTEITLIGNRRLATPVLEGYLRRELGIEPGVATVLLDPGAIASRLRELPEVARAEATVLWPDQLVVDLGEREAAGIVVTPTGSFVFDETGLLFDHASATDFLDAELPVYTGFEAQALDEEGRLPAEALATLEMYRHTFAKAAPELHARVGEFHWSDEAGVTLVLDDGTRIECGTLPPEEAGPVLEELLAMPAYHGRLASATVYTTGYATVRLESGSRPVADARPTSR